jgi:hypothetical protein
MQTAPQEVLCLRLLPPSTCQMQATMQATRHTTGYTQKIGRRDIQHQRNCFAFTAITTSCCRDTCQYRPRHFSTSAQQALPMFAWSVSRKKQQLECNDLLTCWRTGTSGPLASGLGSCTLVLVCLDHCPCWQYTAGSHQSPENSGPLHMVAAFPNGHSHH